MGKFLTVGVSLRLEVFKLQTRSYYIWLSASLSVCWSACLSARKGHGEFWLGSGTERAWGRTEILWMCGEGKQRQWGLPLMELDPPIPPPPHIWQPCTWINNTRYFSVRNVLKWEVKILLSIPQFLHSDLHKIFFSFEAMNLCLALKRAIHMHMHVLLSSGKSENKLELSWAKLKL